MSNANKPSVSNAIGTTAAKPSLPAKPPFCYILFLVGSVHSAMPHAIAKTKLYSSVNRLWLDRIIG
ncbi:hypothetical protein HanOQP8_Chr13g0473321 [Helianthus annuus]|nr:hypothetical protein HanIR_Chr13g0627221 [Helianthus annuus]KAJ0670364.1 hypothetical protein HanOQP8_Chr13g0473321 [Helianthus annuus]